MAARASGVDADLRRDHPHDGYEGLRFEVPVEEGGDVRARLMIRAREVEQSLLILHQILDALPDSPLVARLPERLPAAGIGTRLGGSLARTLHALDCHRRARATSPASR